MNIGWQFFFNKMATNCIRNHLPEFFQGFPPGDDGMIDSPCKIATLLRFFNQEEDFLHNGLINAEIQK